MYKLGEYARNVKHTKYENYVNVTGNLYNAGIFVESLGYQGE